MWQKTPVPVSLLAAVCLLQAQPATLSGPICGFVFDAPSRSVRPLIGIPGSAYLGAPIYSEVEFASVAPNGKMAVAARQGRLLLLRDLNGARPAESLLEVGIGTPDMVGWAPDSSALVLYSSAQGSVQRITLPNDALVVDAPLDVSVLGGVVVAVATDTAGRSVVIGIRDEAAGGFYLLGAGAPPLRIASVTQPGSAVFSRAGQELYATDLEHQRVLVFRGLPAHVSVESLPLGSTIEMAGVALSRDDQRLLVADRTGNGILRIYQASSLALAAEVVCDVPPTLIHPLSESSLFLLNSRGGLDDPIFVLDARSTPTVYFVPAAEQE